MKRLIALSLALFILFGFAGCGKGTVDPAKSGGKNGKRISYNYDMKKYVSLGNYKGIEVDKSGETYKNYYDSYYNSLVSSANAYNYIKEGKLAKNDTAMIKYVGKIEGKEFQGGSSTEEFALTLGSGQFIPGFEDALIGKEIGKTTVINLKFPEDYDQLTYFVDDKEMKNGFNLKGKAVQFSVEVVSVQKLPEKNADTAKKLGFKDEAEMLKVLEESAIENSITNTILNSKDFAVKSFPEKEKANYDTIYSELYESAERETAAYNAQNGTSVTVEEMFYAMYGLTTDNYSYYVQNMLKNETILYAIFDAEKLSYTEEEFNAFLQEIANEGAATIQDVKDNYAGKEWQLESMMIQQIAMEFVVKAAVVK